MPGGIELRNEVLKNETCTLCGACLDWCPYIKNLQDHLVMPFECKQENGRCYSVCPRTFTDWDAINRTFFSGIPESIEIGPMINVLMAKRKHPIEGQQNGGTVTTLVRNILKDDDETAAILTGFSDGSVPVPILIEDLDEITNTTGSRFLASPSLRKLIEAKQKGVKKLVIVGRPCQIQAVRKAQQSYPEAFTGEVITIGLFCMWSLGWEFLNYVKSQYPGCTIQRISIPQHGLEVHTDQGVKVIPNEKVKDFVRKGCHYCLDMTSELADISVGAMEINQEWNTVIVRSQQGKELLELASDDLVFDNYPEEELERLKKASLNKKKRNVQIIVDAVQNKELKSFIDLSHNHYKSLIERQVDN